MRLRWSFCQSNVIPFLGQTLPSLLIRLFGLNHLWRSFLMFSWFFKVFSCFLHILNLSSSTMQFVCLTIRADVFEAESGYVGSLHTILVLHVRCIVQFYAWSMYFITVPFYSNANLKEDCHTSFHLFFWRIAEEGLMMKQRNLCDWLVSWWGWRLPCRPENWWNSAFHLIVLVLLLILWPLVLVSDSTRTNISQL